MTTSLPAFSFYIGDPAVPFSEHVLQWFQPLPLSRQPSDTRPEQTVTYGDYFQAVSDFITRHLTALLSSFGKSPVPAPEVENAGSVEIHLVKHGACYHPAKVTLHAGPAEFRMAVNVAVSLEGRTLISAEAANLQRLDQDAVPRPLIPKVHIVGEGAVPGKPPLPMFATEWFDGFCEFHATRRPGETEKQQWKVWDAKGDWFLSRDQVMDVCRQAAFILTCCYHPLTFEAVQEWHHAAGDFIIRRQDNGMEVRLITVRRYEPLFDRTEAEDITLVDTLDGLILFLLELSLRMRLDRLDGVGQMVWAENWMVPSVWQGFVEGLHRMAVIRNLPAEFIDGVMQYAAVQSVDDWVGLGRFIEKRFCRLPEEKALIHRHLAEHAGLLVNVIRNDSP